MPRIQIFEQDNTGVEYTGGETVVFVPGSLEIKEGLEDNNHCVYINTADYTRLADFFETDINNLTDNDKTDLGTLIFIQTCLSHNMDVIYCHVEDFGGKKVTATIPKDDYENEGQKEEKIKEAKTSADGDRILLPHTLVWQEDPAENGPYKAVYTDTLDFLQDKDNYNIKFLTTGCLNAIGCELDPDGILQDSNSKVNAKFDFSIANALTKIASERKDCAALLSVDYSTAKVKNGDIFADQLSAAINTGADGGDNVQDGKGLETTGGQESYGAIFLPNFTTSVSIGTTTNSITMPSIWGYLAKYGTCLGKGQEWLSIANSTRGSVADMGTPDLIITKYNMDETIIKDNQGSSFNGIVNLRPYGSVIWGDRTLLKLVNKVKATAYLSLRMLICDVSKRAYQAAVRNTYESNNDITWFNFKSRITDLLSEVVAAGVLSNYSVTKAVAIEKDVNIYNTITCKITLYPNLPVENFDIYINLENAEITTAGAGNDKV